MEIYFTSKLESKEDGHRYLRIPAEIYDRADYANRKCLTRWLVPVGEEGSPPSERTAAFTLYVSPFGDDSTPTHQDIFAVEIRMQSRSNAFAPVLGALSHLGINVLHCSSIDMGTQSQGEPARLLVKIPPRLGAELRELTARLPWNSREPSNQFDDKPLQAGRLYLKALLEAWDKANTPTGPSVKQIREVLEAAMQFMALPLQSNQKDENAALTTKLHSLNQRSNEAVAAAQQQIQQSTPVPRDDLFILSLLADPASDDLSPRPRRHAVADLIEDLLFAALVLQPQTLISIQTPLHLRASVDVQEPVGWSDFLSIEKTLKSPPCKPFDEYFFPDPKQPEWFLLQIPNEPTLQDCSFATLTFYVESHLIRVTFKNREEEIITVGANFTDRHGELSKLVKPLGKLNVDLRLIQPLRRQAEKDFWPSDLGAPRGVLYEVVANIRSSKLSLFDDESLPKLIRATMVTTGVAADEVTQLKIHRVTPPLMPRLSIECADPQDGRLTGISTDEAKVLAQAHWIITPPAPTQRDHSFLYSRSYSVILQPDRVLTLSCSIIRPEHCDLEGDLLCRLMDDSMKRTKAAYQKDPGDPLLLTAALLDNYSTALYGAALHLRLSKIRQVFMLLQKQGGKVPHGLREVFKNNPTLQTLFCTKVPVEEYLAEAYFTLECDYIPFVRGTELIWKAASPERTKELATENIAELATAGANEFWQQLDSLRKALALVWRRRNDDLDQAVKTAFNSAAQQIFNLCFKQPSGPSTAAVREGLKRT